MTKYLKVKDLQELLGLSRATIYRMKDNGLPFVKISGSIRFEEEAVKKWIEQQQDKK